MISVVDRFLKYVSFDTQSDEMSETCPSTMKQKDLGAALVEEMLQMGITDARMDDNGYVYGTVPGDPSLPTIGLIAHMDTAPDAPGNGIKAKIVAYNGGDVVLNEEKNIVMTEADFPNLKNHVGKHLIVTDGTTLLGADDKAGIAEIMTAAEYLLKNGGRHATIKLGFTPDEEIGRGADLFNVKDFGADYAYTADGGTVGEIEFENFNAASAKVEVRGLNIHPGSAKNKMVNSQLIAIEYHNMLPVAQRPEYTEGYEGFYHLDTMSATCDSAKMSYIIRDHDAAKFEARKKLFTEAVAFMNAKHGEGTVELDLSDTYRNMREIVEQHPHLIENAKRAYAELGIQWYTEPVRGGTDGASLCRRGLPCPNLATGGHNCHGRYEYCAAESLDTMVEVLVKVAGIYAE